MKTSKPTTYEELRAANDAASTVEQALRVRELIAAFHAAETTTVKQKGTLERLQQQAAAWLIGVSTKHLRDHGAARNQDLTYNGPDLVEWIVERRIEAARKEWERGSDVEKTAKERQAEARADKLEEEAKGLKDTYVERETVYLEFQEMAAAVRAELEALPKVMATDFPEALRDSLTRELRGQCRQILRRLANKGQRIGGE